MHAKKKWDLWIDTGKEVRFSNRRWFERAMCKLVQLCGT